ncbi:MAG TPA: hypothetical protein VGM02_12810 [Acidobacteriaceae bacterium]
MQPHVLLLATQRWPAGVRLGLAMRAVGFRVSIWCPRSHPLLLTHAVHRHHPYSVLDTVDSLEAAIIAADPQLIVPCDEPATINLQQVTERALATPRLHHLLSVIERSLGPVAGIKRLTERAYVLQVAAEAGAAVPLNTPITTPAELRAWLSLNGFPAYLKSDGTFGGVGVRRIHAYDEAEAAFRALHASPGTIRALKRMALDYDPTLLGPLFRRRHPLISVQRAVPGVDTNSAIFCWQGQVLAGITMQVVVTDYEMGPSTVLRRIHNPAMDHTAEVLASRLNLSGFFGLDFILDEQTGIPWLLEMNSRATQIVHLALGAGHDLPAAAFSAMCGVPVRPRPTETTEEIIALFPQEWDRDPTSQFIQNAYHDVPWNVPELVRAYVSQRPGWRQLVTRRYWRKRRQQKPHLEAPAPSETAPRLP